MKTLLFVVLVFRWLIEVALSTCELLLPIENLSQRIVKRGWFQFSLFGCVIESGKNSKEVLVIGS